MELEVTDIRPFREIQEAFNQVYPFLWIDFFEPPAKAGANHMQSYRIKPETMVKRFCAFDGIKTINMDRTRVVAQLEADFWEILQVKVKVLRKSGNVWVETAYTRNWTLAEQNFEGEQIILDL
jgi:hypothetical protein